MEVFHRAWPVDDAKAVVVISHGASEHSARYDRFATALNAAGYAVWAIDHRGHGETGRSTGTGRMGPGGGDRLVDDLHQLVALAGAADPGKRVVLFGHSMGAFVAQAYATRFADDLAGYVLSGCPGPTAEAPEMIAGLQAMVDGGMGDDDLDLLGGFNEAFEPARTRYDWLSRDTAEVDKYVADPFCGDENPMTYGFALEMLKLATPAMEPAGIAAIGSLPVLLVTGEDDPVSVQAANVRELEGRLRDAGLDVTARYYPDTRHELLNDLDRDQVTADIVAWLDGVV